MAGWLDGGMDGGQSPAQTQSNTGEWKKRFHVHAGDILLTAAAATGSPSVDSAPCGPPKRNCTRNCICRKEERMEKDTAEGQRRTW